MYGTLSKPDTNVSVRRIKNSEIRKYKQLYADEYTIQQPIDSSDENLGKLNMALWWADRQMWYGNMNLVLMTSAYYRVIKLGKSQVTEHSVSVKHLYAYLCSQLSLLL